MEESTKRKKSYIVCKFEIKVIMSDNINRRLRTIREGRT